MPRGWKGSRFLGLWIGLGATVAAVLVASAVALLRAEPETARPDQVEASPAGGRTEESERTRRKAVGSKPLPAQIVEVAAGARLTRAQAVARGHVVTTFKVPVPWDLYEQEQQGGDRIVPETASVVLVYLETDEGYPVMVHSVPGGDPIARLEAFLGNAGRQLEGAPAPISPSQEEIRQAAADLRRRVVIFGFTMPWAEFRRVEEDLREGLPAWFEFTLSPHQNPFKPVDEILTIETVDRFRAQLRS